MTASLPRYYVEKLQSLEPNVQTGIVKLTFSIAEKSEEQAVVQLIVSVPHLHEIFGKVGETMQKTFGGRPPGGGKQRHGMRVSPAERDAELPDITGE
jgi:hypothetical protein